MHLDQRTDHLVGTIPKSSDLPLFLCHPKCDEADPADEIGSAMEAMVSAATRAALG